MTHLNSYLQFCELMDIVPAPASEKTVVQYSAYLPRRLKPSSVKQYLNIIRILHLECGEPHPYQDSWRANSTLKGIEKCKGCAPERKTPTSPEVLLITHRGLHMSCVNACVFWAACLVLFFGLLRKLHIFQDDGAFDPMKQLTIASFGFTDQNSVTLLVNWSKTIQRREKTLSFQLPTLPDHPLCLTLNVINMLRLLGSRPPKSQAFPVTRSYFNKCLRALTSAAARTFSSHSFRRGVAAWALSCGILGEIVKLMGDWASTSYLRYLDQIPTSVIERYRLLFARQLPRH